MKLSDLTPWRLPLYIARLNEKNSKKEEEKIVRMVKKEIREFNREVQ
jgi:hypothetical protein